MIPNPQPDNPLHGITLEMILMLNKLLAVIQNQARVYVLPQQVQGAVYAHSG